MQHDGAAAVNGGQLPQLPNNSGDVAAAAHQASSVTQIKLTKVEQDTKAPGQDQEGTQFDIHTWLNCVQGFKLHLFSFQGASGSSGPGAPQPVMLKITKSQDELEDDLDEADDDNQNKVIGRS